MAIKKDRNGFEHSHFEIPPDGSPSKALLSKISQAKDAKRPLLYIARMNRMPYGYILYLKAEFL